MTSVDRRLADIEARLALIAPPPSAEWAAFLRWATDAEVDELERIFRGAADAGRDLTDPEWRRVGEIDAAVDQRQRDGEPAR